MTCKRIQHPMWVLGVPGKGQVSRRLATHRVSISRGHLATGRDTSRLELSPAVLPSHGQCQPSWAAFWVYSALCQPCTLSS